MWNRNTSVNQNGQRSARNKNTFIPRNTPKIPTMAGKTGGAGIGNLRAVKTTPQMIPASNDNKIC